MYRESFYVTHICVPTLLSINKDKREMCYTYKIYVIGWFMYTYK